MKEMRGTVRQPDQADHFGIMANRRRAGWTANSMDSFGKTAAMRCRANVAVRVREISRLLACVACVLMMTRRRRRRRTCRCELSRSTIFMGIWSRQITRSPCPIPRTLRRRSRCEAAARRSWPRESISSRRSSHGTSSCLPAILSVPRRLTSGLFHDEPTIEVMNAIGLDISALGNHEFDRGVAHLLRLANGGCQSQPIANRQTCAGVDGKFSGARFSFLAANVLDRENEQPIVAPTWIKNIDGVRVGFIGAVTRSTPGIVVPSGVAGVRFIGEAKALNQLCKGVAGAGRAGDRRRRARGRRRRRRLRRVPKSARRDLRYRTRARSSDRHRALGAHASRLQLRDRWQSHHSGGLLRKAGFGDRHRNRPRHRRDRARAHARAQRAGAERRADRVRRCALRIRRSRPIPKSPRSSSTIESSQHRWRSGQSAASLADFDRRASAGGDNALGRLIADAQLAATRTQGAQLAFTNPGGLRADLRASGGDGVVTYADAFASQPFGNTLVTLTLTGAQLKQLLEQQWSARSSASTARPERARMLQPSRGFSYAWRASGSHGERIVADSMRLDGRAIESRSNLSRDRQQFSRRRRRRLSGAARRHR